MGILSKKDMDILHNGPSWHKTANMAMQKRTPEEICSQPASLLHLDPEAKPFRKVLGYTMIEGRRIETVVYDPKHRVRPTGTLDYQSEDEDENTERNAP